MKKIFRILFSIYFFTLTSTPCLCADEHSSDSSHTQVTKSYNRNSNHADDGCTPFCSCSCCPNTTICTQKIIYINEPAIAYITQKSGLTDQSFISYLSRNIWQPPRLV